MTEMTYRPLGSSGLMVSTVGIGCNAFGARIDADAVQGIVDAAIEEGVTLFDTADTYGLGESEKLLGAALGERREDVVVATKFGMDMQGANGSDWGARGSRRYIRRAVEASLRRLGTDWIDLYQMHRPCPVTPIEETLAALHELVQEGKVRYVGSSNFAGWQVVDADWTARTGGYTAFVSAQNKYSLLDRAAEQELIPAAETVGVGILPFFPLEYGLLTGKYRRDQAAPAGSRLAADSQAERLAGADWDEIERIEAFAAERGRSVLDVAIGGLAAQPGVSSVIAGVTSADQVPANVAAGSWEPTVEDLAQL
ncbi:aldo/keto reductase [Ornithinicoccus hortensis]|uniref:Aryl-alcohol dehydrogenase-like predicted oxidoreductase n=2 Tax=Ornithinicoccus hortensis TaxID=82346 RepID=A0A542YVM3_9MICO|nr:aldo/keto reductase [Ornithinicoccus hortensis]TQL52138.1 aryl-alcohol dehydrogenase-like predicted oxidoreductase [Ornithinicoccus hortensis]